MTRELSLALGYRIGMQTRSQRSRLLALSLTLCLYVACGASGAGEQGEECGGDVDGACADVTYAKVPLVVGMTLTEARARLGHFQLDIRTRDGSPALATSKVVDQDPKSGKLTDFDVVRLTLEGSDL